LTPGPFLDTKARLHRRVLFIAQLSAIVTSYDITLKQWISDVPWFNHR